MLRHTFIEHDAAFDGLAQTHVDGLNGMGRVNHFADLCRVIEQRKDSPHPIWHRILPAGFQLLRRSPQCKWWQISRDRLT